MAIVWLVLGLLLLIVGAEVLVRGASRLAMAFGMPPLVVGLTVVAFGTSAPEFAVSIGAAVDGQAGIALGNVVGSNIFNVLGILGLSAVITPLLVSRRLVRYDVPLMLGVSLATLALGWNGTIGRLEGACLFAGLLVYTGLLLRRARVETGGTESTAKTARGGRWPVDVAFVLVGLGLLALGARWLVQGAVAIAQSLGLGELVIGLTIVAVGTSLPEVVTSVIASMRGQRDIAVGNVVGSNLFNLLGVLGLTAAVAPGGVPVSAAALGFDLPVMVAAALVCLPMFFTGGVISRWEGWVLLAYYAAYTTYLVLAATEHDALPVFSVTMLWFALPLTGLGLVLTSLRACRKSDAPRNR